MVTLTTSFPLTLLCHHGFAVPASTGYFPGQCLPLASDCWFTVTDGTLYYTYDLSVLCQSNSSYTIVDTAENRTFEFNICGNRWGNS